jgi:hypothetical protein
MRQIRLAAAAIGVVLAMLAPQNASAAQPVRFPAFPFTGTFSAGLLCDFAIYTQPVDNDFQTVTVFFDSSGDAVKAIFTGSLFILLRNVNTGKTIIVNASGQGTTIPRPDGSSLNSGSGPGLIGVLAGDPAGRQLTLVIGRETFIGSAPDANGFTHISDLVIVGQSFDLCAVLAA